MIVALANALEIAPSEITALPVPAPANGDTDTAVHAVRRALLAVGGNRPAAGAGDYDRAVTIADGLHPRVQPNRSKLVTH
jgi:hypothetical protein